MYDATIDDLLAKWDGGQSFFSLEMGGLGPGYEQAIQTAAVEFARAGKAFVPTGDNEADGKAWDALCTETLHALDDKLSGLSGAMYGAAQWLAWKWCHGGGPKALLEQAKAKGASERIIQVSKDWPHL